MLDRATHPLLARGLVHEAMGSLLPVRLLPDARGNAGEAGRDLASAVPPPCASDTCSEPLDSALPCVGLVVCDRPLARHDAEVVG